MGRLSSRNITFLYRILIAFLLVSEVVFAANINDSLLVGGTGPADTKAQLDVRSVTKGVLLPRMTTTQQNAISSPTEGLLIYDNVLHQLSNYNGTSWTAVGGTPAAATLTVLGTVKALAPVSHQFLTGITSGTGVPTQAQPAFSDISGTATSAQLPNPTASTLGGIESLVSTSHQWINTISTSGVPSSTQPAFSDISGTASLTTQVTGALPIGNGGTGQTTASAALLALVPAQSVGNLGQALVSSGNAGVSPTWGVLNAAGGGTGLSTLTAHGVLIGNGTSAINVTSAGTATQVLTSNGPSADPTWQAAAAAPVGVSAYNFLVNSGFDFWQAGTSTVITATGGATPTNTYTYQADQWYVNNILGGGTIEGQITYNQVSLLGSGVATKYGATIQITRAPTGTGIQNGTELWQTLSNRATIPLIGQTASFSLPVLALNNVNQVGLQFFYSTSEIKAGTSIGAETTCAVNNSTYTTCSISGQALGTSMTYSGTVGVRVRTTAVSSGNTYDLNNGFQVATAMWNIGSTAATFARQSNNPASELIACQYFYEKSYAITTAPGTNVGVAADGGWVFRHIYTATGTGATRMSIKYLVPKRTAAAVTTWSTDGTLGKIRDATNSTNITPSVITSGTMGWTIEVAPSATTIDHNLEGHWQADARL